MTETSVGNVFPCQKFNCGRRLASHCGVWTSFYLEYIWSETTMACQVSCHLTRGKVASLSSVRLVTLKTPGDLLRVVQLPLRLTHPVLSGARRAVQVMTFSRVGDTAEGAPRSFWPDIAVCGLGALNLAETSRYCSVSGWTLPGAYSLTSV